MRPVGSHEGRIVLTFHARAFAAGARRAKPLLGDPRGAQLIARFNLRQRSMKKLIHPLSDLPLRDALCREVF